MTTPAMRGAALRGTAQRGLLLLLLALGLTVAAPSVQHVPAQAALSAAHVDHGALPSRVEDQRAGRLDPGHAPLPAALPPTDLVARPDLTTLGLGERMAPVAGADAGGRTSRGPPEG
jgi:hypothetical protein